MNTKNKIKIYIIPILCIGLLVAFDQITKFIVRTSFALYESHPLIKNVFHLTYIQNTGIAWGMFKKGRIIFLILTVLVLLVCEGIPIWRKNTRRPMRTVYVCWTGSSRRKGTIREFQLHWWVSSGMMNSPLRILPEKSRTV